MNQTSIILPQSFYRWYDVYFSTTRYSLRTLSNNSVTVYLFTNNPKAIRARGTYNITKYNLLSDE